MSYNTHLQQNNAELRSILDTVNALPEAGSGGAPAEPVLQEKNVTPTTSAQSVIPDSGYDGLSKVNVGAIPSEYIVPNGNLEITQNGSHNVTEYASVEVNVPSEDVSTVLTEQENLISELQELLRVKSSGGSGGGTDTRFVDCAMGTLTEVNDDTITKTRQYAFSHNSSLVTVNLPNLTSIEQSVFRYCSNLEAVYCPKLPGNLPAYVFQNCYKLKTVNVPNVIGMTTSVFQDCRQLERLELGNISSISGTNTFKNCTNLTTLIIRRTGTSATTLGNVNSFTGTPIESGTGYIYVPSALLDAYKTATNWSTYASQIRAIEDYPDICGGGA